MSPDDNKTSVTRLLNLEYVIIGLNPYERMIDSWICGHTLVESTYLKMKDKKMIIK